MNKEINKVDTKQQIFLWGLTLAAAIVLGVRSPLVSSIAVVVIGFIWDRMDLTYGQNTLPGKFLPVTGGIFASLVLAVVCMLIYNGSSGQYAIWEAIKGEYDLHMQSEEFIAIVYAVIAIALLLLMYVLTAFLVTAILAFTQKALDDLLGRPFLPYGAAGLVVAWALPCFVRGSGGLAALLLSLVFGGFYLLMRKNAVITFFAVFFCLVACFKP